jgi:LysR family glycine cleavage system transcriptional activator
MFPVCAPSLVKGKNALKKPSDLARVTLLHMSNQRDDWRLWLTAAGAKGVDPSRGPVFDQAMTVLQAAMDGLGVAIGHGPLVERDIKAGRLVAPFDVTLPVDAAYYLVAPPSALRRHKVKSFREWLLAMASKAQS